MTFNEQIDTTLPAQDVSKPYRWSGDRDVPPIGARVTISFNDLGAGEVIGYRVTDGYLGLWIKLDRSPTWRVAQGFGDDFPALVYGAEILEQRRAS